MIASLLFIIIFSSATAFQLNARSWGSVAPSLRHEQPEFGPAWSRRARKVTPCRAANSDDESESTITTEEATSQESQEPSAEELVLEQLKQDIADLESKIRTQRDRLSYVQNDLDDYSKAGYARKVAEMEQMRRNQRVRVLFALCLVHVVSHHKLTQVSVTRWFRLIATCIHLRSRFRFNPISATARV
jgi:hypothetical protein